MANEQNLVSLGDRTAEERKAIGSKGGKRSVEVRRERKTMRESLIALLSLPVGEGDMFDTEEAKSFRELEAKNLTVQDVLNLAMLKKARGGDVSAYTSIRDTIGEKPSDKVDVSGGVPVFIKGDDGDIFD